MIVGVPREIKNNEFRVALVPAGVEMLCQEGHQVLVEKGAGLGTGIEDADYQAAGGKLVDRPEDVFGPADLVVKVKEPLPQEYAMLRAGQVLFTYFHFAASEELTRAMIECG